MGVGELTALAAFGLSIVGGFMKLSQKIESNNIKASNNEKAIKALIANDERSRDQISEIHQSIVRIETKLESTLDYIVGK